MNILRYVLLVGLSLCSPPESSFVSVKLDFVRSSLICFFASNTEPALSIDIARHAYSYEGELPTKGNISYIEASILYIIRYNVKLRKALRRSLHIFPLLPVMLFVRLSSTSLRPD